MPGRRKLVMGGRAERLRPLLSAIPRYTPPLHTHPLPPTFSLLCTWWRLWYAAGSSTSKPGKKTGTSSWFHPSDPGKEFILSVCARSWHWPHYSGSATASVKRRKGTIRACGGCRNARPRRRKFSRRISRNRCGPIFQIRKYSVSEKLSFGNFRIREIYLIRKFPNPKNLSHSEIFFLQARSIGPPSEGDRGHRVTAVWSFGEIIIQNF